MTVYQTKAKIIPGKNFKSVEKIALKIFKKVKSQSRRTPYIRSNYFNKDKIFLNIFWSHLYEKRNQDRLNRLRYYDCALDLIKNSRLKPTTKVNLYNKNELFHRFSGQTKEGEVYFIQVKENIKTKRKDFISILPPK